MRFVAPILTGLSLALGTIACMNAYLPRLDVVESAIRGGEELHLGAPAGKVVATDGKISPVASPGTKLTPELVAQLRAAGVTRVRVRQFSFARWSDAWLFGVSVVGLVVGAVLIRRSRNRRVVEDGDSPVVSPEAAMDALRDSLRDLETRLPRLCESERGLQRVTEEIGVLQSTHIDAILQSRDRIVAVGGLAGFAAFMSAFSVMERQINRAWSAAADEEPGEACDSIRRALLLSEDARKLLPTAR